LRENGVKNKRKIGEGIRCSPGFSHLYEVTQDPIFIAEDQDMRYLFLPALVSAGALGLLLAAPSASRACPPGGWYAGYGARPVYVWYGPAGPVYYYTVVPGEERTYSSAPSGTERRAYYYTPDGQRRALPAAPEFRQPVSFEEYYPSTAPSYSPGPGEMQIFDRWKPDEHSPFYPRGG
jgi:hypothetical protein